MKKFAIALVLLLGLLNSNSAYADWFDRYDHNHDRRWDRHEFYNAQRNWNLSHRGYPAAGWGPGFANFDRNHDRYWDRHEAWRYHHW